MYCDGKGKPFQDIRINHTIVLHDPFEDPGVREVGGDSFSFQHVPCYIQILGDLIIVCLFLNYWTVIQNATNWVMLLLQWIVAVCKYKIIEFNFFLSKILIIIHNQTPKVFDNYYLWKLITIYWKFLPHSHVFLLDVITTCSYFRFSLYHHAHPRLPLTSLILKGY